MDLPVTRAIGGVIGWRARPAFGRTVDEQAQWTTDQEYRAYGTCLGCQREDLYSRDHIDMALNAMSDFDNDFEQGVTRSKRVAAEMDEDEGNSEGTRGKRRRIGG